MPTLPNPIQYQSPVANAIANLGLALASGPSSREIEERAALAAYRDQMAAKAAAETESIRAQLAGQGAIAHATRQMLAGADPRVGAALPDIAASLYATGKLGDLGNIARALIASGAFDDNALVRAMAGAGNAIGENEAVSLAGQEKIRAQNASEAYRRAIGEAATTGKYNLMGTQYRADQDLAAAKYRADAEAAAKMLAPVILNEGQTVIPPDVVGSPQDARMRAFTAPQALSVRPGERAQAANGEFLVGPPTNVTLDPGQVAYEGVTGRRLRGIDDPRIEAGAQKLLAEAERARAEAANTQAGAGQSGGAVKWSDTDAMDRALLLVLGEDAYKQILADPKLKADLYTEVERLNRAGMPPYTAIGEAVARILQITPPKPGIMGIGGSDLKVERRVALPDGVPPPEQRPIGSRRQGPDGAWYTWDGSAWVEEVGQAAPSGDAKQDRLQDDAQEREDAPPQSLMTSRAMRVKGRVYDGWRYLGGNPRDPRNWERAQ